MNGIAVLLGRARSLQLRFMLTLVVGTALFSAVAGGLAYRLGHERALASSRSTLEGLARAVEKTVAIGAFAADRVLVQEVVDGLARNDLVAAVEVHSARGEPLAHSERGGSATVASADMEMSVDRPLVSPFDAAERVGVLRIRADHERIGAAATQEAYTLGALMAGQTALVALLLYGVAAWLVSRPIVRLARQLLELPPGTDERLATPALHQHDEIGILITAANALLDANAVALQRERGLRAEVEAMEAQYRQIFDSSSAGIFVLDTDGRLINGNPTVSRVVGLSLAQMRGLQHDNFVKRVFGQPEQVQVMMEQAARLGETVSGDLELVQHGTSRRWVHCLISVQGGTGRSDAGQCPATVEGVIYDITERKSAETAVRYRSEHDALTGLKNRASTDAAVDRLIADAIASGMPVSVLCVDLDGFKQVNDEFGHHAGDQVLVACAERMQAAVRRSSDLVGRLGGDEFLVALRDVGPSDPALCVTAAALLDALKLPFLLEDGTQVWIGASIGIACLPRHGSDRPSLTHAADAAMYEVKRGGKNCFAMAIGLPLARHGAAGAGTRCGEMQLAAGMLT